MLGELPRHNHYETASGTQRCPFRWTCCWVALVAESKYGSLKWYLWVDVGFSRLWPAAKLILNADTFIVDQYKCGPCRWDLSHVPKTWNFQIVNPVQRWWIWNWFIPQASYNTRNSSIDLVTVGPDKAATRVARQATVDDGSSGRGQNALARWVDHSVARWCTDGVHLNRLELNLNSIMNRTIIA